MRAVDLCRLGIALAAMPCLAGCGLVLGEYDTGESDGSEAPPLRLPLTVDAAREPDCRQCAEAECLVLHDLCAADPICTGMLDCYDGCDNPACIEGCRAQRSGAFVGFRLSEFDAVCDGDPTCVERRQCHSECEGDRSCIGRCQETNALLSSDLATTLYDRYAECVFGCAECSGDGNWDCRYGYGWNRSRDTEPVELDVKLQFWQLTVLNDFSGPAREVEVSLCASSVTLGAPICSAPATTDVWGVAPLALNVPPISDLFFEAHGGLYDEAQRFYLEPVLGGGRVLLPLYSDIYYASLYRSIADEAGVPLDEGRSIVHVEVRDCLDHPVRDASVAVTRPEGVPPFCYPGEFGQWNQCVGAATPKRGHALLVGVPPTDGPVALEVSRPDLGVIDAPAFEPLPNGVTVVRVYPRTQ